MNPFASTIALSSLEARILGALIEKADSTPEYYPLTFHALLAACNQKNNRTPVLSLDDATLAAGIVTLQDKGLVESFAGAGARALKYRERLGARLGLAPDERALICELLLRGPQTLGELRAHAGRLHPFADTQAVQTALDRLAARPDSPLVAEAPRQPGRKEPRFFHLLGDGPPVFDPAPPESAPPPPAAMAAARDTAATLAALESRVAALEAALDDLRSRLTAFQSQFE